MTGSSKGTRAEKYGDPQLITEIKTTLERKLRETLGEEYEQRRDHVKIPPKGETPSNNTTITTKTRPKPQQHQTKRKNLKTHKNKQHAPSGPLRRGF
jgi:hypothetical protein